MSICEYRKRSNFTVQISQFTSTANYSFSSFTGFKTERSSYKYRMEEVDNDKRLKAEVSKLQRENSEDEIDDDEADENSYQKVLLRRRNSVPSERLSCESVACVQLAAVAEASPESGRRNENGFNDLHLQRRTVQRAASNSRVQYAMIRAAIAEDNRMELQTLLRRRDVKINDIEADGLATIHYAAMNGTRKTVEILIDEGANINLITSLGEYPLDIAVRTGNFDIAQFLIEKGARLDNVIDGTPLEREKRHQLRRTRRAYTIDMPT